MKPALVIRGGALGDFILTLPVIRALRAYFDEVNLLANRRFIELIPGARFALDDSQLAPFFASTSELPEYLRDYFQRHDVIISYLYDPQNVFETNVRKCGAGQFICGTHRVEPGSHATEQLACPLHQLGIPISDFVPKLDLNKCGITVPGAEIAAGATGAVPSQNENFFGEKSGTTRQLCHQLFALHPGSGSARKNWSLENWLGLIDQLLASNKRLVIIGGEADLKQITRIRETFGESVDYAIDWPLRKLAALLMDANFIGHDSGISHLAAAVGARCVVLFGPTDGTVWAPRGENVRVITAAGKDLRRLEISDVLDALTNGR